ncbi:MAG: hypothetical protein AAF408_17780, partial [Pseudomonadota bacterium]
MDVILHIGAHRCATTSFQHYLRTNSKALAAVGTGFWGPLRTRSGLFDGVLPCPLTIARRNPARAAGRIRLNLARSAANGVRRLVVSDENMLGSMRKNEIACALYPAAGERMARFRAAFGADVTDVVLNIRSLDHYWASVLGHLASCGHPLPDRARLDRLTVSVRGWRDVVTDLACALPSARLWVFPFETFAGRPDAQLVAMTGRPAPRLNNRVRRNPTPRLDDLRALWPDAGLPAGDGRWMPFADDQVAHLRERYADDMMWLTSGADGLAWLMNDPE